jgi:molybdopterin synthase catalytic subunit
MELQCLIEGPIPQSLILQITEDFASRKDSGGHSIFIGQVRADIIDTKKVKAIEYSAYETMAETESERIKNEVLKEFNDVRHISIIHSTGVVTAGEISLVIAVSGGHRQQTILACSKAVELVKERLPVWKKEIFEDNSYAWKQNNADQTDS